MTKGDSEKWCDSTKWHSWKETELRFKQGSLASNPRAFLYSWCRKPDLLLGAEWGEPWRAADDWQLRGCSPSPVKRAQARLMAEEGKQCSEFFVCWFLHFLPLLGYNFHWVKNAQVLSVQLMSSVKCVRVIKVQNISIIPESFMGTPFQSTLLPPGKGFFGPLITTD